MEMDEKSCIGNTADVLFPTSDMPWVQLINPKEEMPLRSSLTEKIYECSENVKTQSKRYKSEKKFACGECGRAFSSSSNLKRHIRNVHDRKSPFQCSSPIVCPAKYEKSCTGNTDHELFPTSDMPLVQLINPKEETPFLSSLKEETYEGSENVEAQSKEYKSEKGFTCGECGRAFSYSSNLKKHIRNVHNRKQPFKCSSPIACPVKCEKSCIGNTDHELFQTSDMPLVQLINPKEETPFLSSLTEETHEGSENVKAQSKEYKSGKEFTCGECGKEYNNSSRLTRHIRIVHSGERPFKCSTCLATFAEGATLRKHIRLHTGEKPYSCDICDIKFSQTSNLHSHKLIHTGEEPRCMDCGASFSKYGNLKRHIERRHSLKKKKVPTATLR